MNPVFTLHFYILSYLVRKTQASFKEKTWYQSFSVCFGQTCRYMIAVFSDSLVVTNVTTRLSFHVNLSVTLLQLLKTSSKYFWEEGKKLFPTHRRSARRCNFGRTTSALLCKHLLLINILYIFIW